MKQYSWLDRLLPDRIDALLIAGGAAPNTRLLRSVAGRASQVIAIDGGIRHVRALSLCPQIVIGDLDSAAPQDLTWARRRRARVVFVREQESSDIEKALTFCVGKRCKSVVAAGVDGDRPDHVLNAMGRIPGRRGLQSVMLFSNAIGLPLIGRRSRRLELPIDASLSWMGVPRAAGCTMLGVRWPFANRVLELRGFQSLSNRATNEEVIVKQKSGVSLIIIPIP